MLNFFNCIACCVYQQTVSKFMLYVSLTTKQYEHIILLIQLKPTFIDKTD